MKVVLAVIGGIVAVLGLAWVLVGNEFFLFSYFAPKFEAVRRETFEQSKAYRQGMAQELSNMKREWEDADAAHKTALAEIILHRAADVDEESLPPYLRTFLADLRRQKAGG